MGKRQSKLSRGTENRVSLGLSLQRMSRKYSRRGRYKSSYHHYQLTFECYQGNHDAVVTILESGEDADMRDLYGETPLTAACAKGHLNIIQLLISEKANINKPNKNSLTPLMIASQYGQLEVVKSLVVEHGAKVNKTNNQGRSSIMMASQNGYAKVVEFLIDKGAEINKHDQGGTTPLMLASEGQHKDTVRILKDKGANVQARNRQGATALDIIKGIRHEQNDIERILTDGNELCCDSAQATVDQIAANVRLDPGLLDQQFSENLLIRIAGHIPNWREYADILGLKPQEINGINTDPQLTYSMKTQELLKTWHRKYAHSNLDKYRTLVQASCDLGLADVAGEICKIIKENSTLPKDDDNTTYLTEDLKFFTNQCIGGGAFGNVFKGQFKKRSCAVKILHSLSSEITSGLPMTAHTNKDTMERFQRECECLELFEHPNIVQHLATKRHPKAGHLVLVLELMDCNLRQYFLSSQREVTFTTQISLCSDIISALEYIHSRHIVHQDLRGDNVLLDCTQEIPVAKVCDFGISRIISTETTSLSLLAIGHRGYLPPEAFTTDSSRFDTSFDIFQLGVLILQIVQCLPTIRSPQERLNEMKRIDSVHPFKPIIEQCLQENRSFRPSATELRRQLASSPSLV